MHADSMNKKQAVFLFESTWKKKYTDRGICKIFSEIFGGSRAYSKHFPSQATAFPFDVAKKTGYRRRSA